MIEPINTIAHSLIQCPFFQLYQLPLTTYSCSEAGFIRTVSWLYSLYREAGKGNTDFVTSKFENYNLDSPRPYIKLIHSLRTSMQHSLNVSESGNSSVVVPSVTWFRGVIGSEVPENSDEWFLCLQKIETESMEFLRQLLQCLQMISEDTYREIIITEWVQRISRFHEPYEFDRVISETINDFGMEHLDPIAFRRHHSDTWLKRLNQCAVGYDFYKEARRLIEATLRSQKVIPITGNDIKRELSVSSPQELRRLFESAHLIYWDTPCSSDELIALLRQKHTSS